MKRKIYNFGTIEVGEMYRGPRVVIGVMAIASESLDVLYLFREDANIKEYIDTITADFENRSEAAKNKGLDGVDLFRSFATPRLSPVQFVARGTRYSGETTENEMMAMLLKRYTPKTVLSK